ncbi:hypothetical protein AB0J40_34250 [Amycolatopsis sp. NPDC049691]|uniref:hypothetical protein n=1 Tax=Amycolatopsis sp. NPDC049691 TaxID=3155155 RepID=UPI00342D46F2
MPGGGAGHGPGSTAHLREGAGPARLRPSGRQVDPADLDVLANLVPGAQPRRVPDLTHLLRRTDGPGTVFGYRKLLRRPVEEDLLTDIARWLAERLG